MNDQRYTFEKIKAATYRIDENREYLEKFLEINNFRYEIVTRLINDNDSNTRYYGYVLLKDHFKANFKTLKFAFFERDYPFYKSFPTEHKLESIIGELCAVYLLYSSVYDQNIDFIFGRIFDEKREFSFRLVLFCEIVHIVYGSIANIISFVYIKREEKSLIGTFDYFFEKIRGVDESRRGICYDFFFRAFSVFIDSDSRISADDFFIKKIVKFLNLYAWSYNESYEATSIISSVLKRSQQVYHNCIEEMLEGSDRLIKTFRETLWSEDSINQDTSVSQNNLSVKLKLFFTILKNTKFDILIYYFDLIPAFIYEANSDILVDLLTSLLNLLSTCCSKSPEFRNNISCKHTRFAIIEALLFQCSNSKKVEGLIIEIITRIIWDFDPEYVFSLFESFSMSLGDVKCISVLSKVLAGVLKDVPSEYMSRIGSCAVELSINILSVVNSYDYSVHQKLLHFLAKIASFYPYNKEFGGESLDHLLDDLMMMLIESKPVFYEPITKYMEEIKRLFPNAKINVDFLQDIPDRHSLEPYLTRLAIQYRDQAPKTDSAVKDVYDYLKWMYESFSWSNSQDIKFMNNNIKRLDIINSMTKETITYFEEMLVNISEYTVLSLNKMMSCKIQNYEQNVMSVTQNLAVVLVKILKNNAALIHPSIQKMDGPTDVTIKTKNWLKKVLLEVGPYCPKEILRNVGNSLIELMMKLTNQPIKNVKDHIGLVIESSKFFEENIQKNLLELALRFDNKGLYQKITEVLFISPFSLTVALWNQLDNGCYPDKLSEFLYDFYSKEQNMEILSDIFDSNIIKDIKRKVFSSTADKSRKKAFRLVISPYIRKGTN